jgi:hypothetical protein
MSKVNYPNLQVPKKIHKQLRHEFNRCIDHKALKFIEGKIYQFWLNKNNREIDFIIAYLEKIVELKHTGPRKKKVSTENMTRIETKVYGIKPATIVENVPQALKQIDELTNNPLLIPKAPAIPQPEQPVQEGKTFTHVGVVKINEDVKVPITRFSDFDYWNDKSIVKQPTFEVEVYND